jgi:hypothetical protein
MIRISQAFDFNTTRCKNGRTVILQAASMPVGRPEGGNRPFTMPRE